jgi:hypothetical protein
MAANGQTLFFDQAIFTSIRGPMGEGYRIIAAGKGLRPEEKQTITRNSPSHDSLCAAHADESEVGKSVGVAFYPLPTGRLCVGYSCFAGAEHTGRGGQRVYTLSLCFAADRFASVGFNPFHVVRAILGSELCKPQLSPPQVLPEVELEISTEERRIGGASWCRSVAPPARKHVLQQLLDDRSVVVNLDADWLDSAEAILLGLPGPLRAKVSWAAGLKFSLGRGYRFHLLFDRTPATRTRTAGQRVEFIEPAAISEIPRRTAWVAFVDRFWDRANLAGLSRRTSQPFQDSGPEMRERVARMYQDIDELGQTDTPKLLANCGERLVPRGDETERGVVREYLENATRELIRRFSGAPWTQVSGHWPALLELARRNPTGTSFAFPIMGAMLRTLMGSDPLQAARLALPLAQIPTPPSAAAVSASATSPLRPSASIVRGLPTSPYLRRMLGQGTSTVPDNTDPNQPDQFPSGKSEVPACNQLLDDVLAALLQWVDQAPSAQRDEAGQVARSWRSVRPQCAMAAALVEKTSRAAVPS